MSTPTATRRSHPEGPGTSVLPARTGGRLRSALVRMVAAAHVVAGALIALSVAVNLALQLNPTGGPMGYFGAESVGLAGCLNNMAHLRVWDASQFAVQLSSYSMGLARHAQTSLAFFGQMAAAYLGLAALCVGIGYGLWRRLPWARRADLVLVGGSAALATIHGVVIIASGFGYLYSGLEVLATTAIVAGPILILLGSPGAAALFGPPAAPGPREARGRRWWTLSVQWLGASLVVAFALGLVRLLFVGPMVEVVWAGALATRPSLGF